MEVALIAIACLIIGAFGSWFIQRDERKYLRDELRVAHAQIAHAVIHDKAEIPARYEEPEPVQPLDSDYQACIKQWEGKENQITVEAEIRNYIGQGWGKVAILKQYGVNA